MEKATCAHEQNAGTELSIMRKWIGNLEWHIRYVCTPEVASRGPGHIADDACLPLKCTWYYALGKLQRCLVQLTVVTYIP